MKPIFAVASTLAAVAALLCAGAGIHEWAYYNDHPYATGVSGVVAILGLGAALGCGAVALLAWAVGHHSSD